MPLIKERMAEVIQEQPADASYEEIMRELTFELMVERGLEDSRKDGAPYTLMAQINWTSEANK